MTVPITVIHIPHASCHIPAEVRSQFLLGEDDLQTELLHMTDAFTDELFHPNPEIAIRVLSPVSRLVVDPERFADDDQEDMAEIGMGVIYRVTSDLRSLRGQIAPGQREHLINAYYRPHHLNLSDAVGRCLQAHGWCLIIDAHSFPSAPLRYERNQSPDRPDVCIGTDDFHTPAWLSTLACDAWRELGYKVALNTPFAGAMVPAAYYRRNDQVWSVMIELNRALYMDEQTGNKKPSFPDIKQHVQEFVARLSETARAGKTR